MNLIYDALAITQSRREMRFFFWLSQDSPAKLSIHNEKGQKSEQSWRCVLTGGPCSRKLFRHFSAIFFFQRCDERLFLGSPSLNTTRSAAKNSAFLLEKRAFSSFMNGYFWFALQTINHKVTAQFIQISLSGYQPRFVFFFIGFSRVFLQTFYDQIFMRAFLNVCFVFNKMRSKLIAT